MCSKQERKPDRKQEILDAAFALTAEQRTWSLGDVANRIGLSKTALYRHFENREAIESAMDDQFIAAVGLMIADSGTDGKKIKQSIVEFLRANPGYLSHLMGHMTMNGSYVEGLLRRLRAISPMVEAFFGSIETLPMELKTRKWIDILKNAVSILLASFAIPGMDELQQDLLAVLETGIPALTVPDRARFDELDEISRIEKSELYESNRLFDAIAASIKEFGINQTTMETIAAKMGTAKSSLYFYSKNKTTMLRDLIASETGTIIRLGSARAAKGKTLAEQLYITMSVQTNYLLLKPDVNPVFNWIRYETIGAHPNRSGHSWDMEKMLEPYRFEELFTEGAVDPAYASMTIRWASILAVSFVIHAIELRLPDADIRLGLRAMLESMLRGDAR